MLFRPWWKYDGGELLDRGGDFECEVDVCGDFKPIFPNLSMTGHRNGHHAMQIIPKL